MTDERRLDYLFQLLNAISKHPAVNLMPIVEEIVKLVGLQPLDVIKGYARTES